MENDTGILVDGASLPTFSGNAVCRNGQDLDMRGEDVFPGEENVDPMCDTDGAS